MLGHTRGADLLPRIQPAVRVEEALERAHRAIQLLAENPAIELAPHEPVAVLARVHPPELRHERTHLLGHTAQRVHGSWLRQVHERPDVKTSRRRVPVEPRPETVSPQQLREPLGVLRQLSWIDSRVFDERDRSLPALPRGAEQPEPRLPQLAKSLQIVFRVVT